MAELLQQAGWSVLARRWQGAGAELDLIVARGSALRFVEVKARTDARVDPLESISRAKQMRLSRAADAWLAQRAGGWDDVAFLVAVVAATDGHLDVRWIDDAFDGV